MTNRLPNLAAAALLAVSIMPFANVASAMPVANLNVSATPANVELAQWRGGGWRGGGWRGGWGGGWRGGWGGAGWGIGAGLLGGAIIGGLLSSPYYYGSSPYYSYPGAYYGAPGYAVSSGNGVAYCMQRFRSYDPNSGTYLGYDGYRHPCP